MSTKDTKYVLARKGSNIPVRYGSKSEICNEWCKKKYQDAPEEEFSVFEVVITPSRELPIEEIEEVVDDEYDKYELWRKGD
ncbi:MAG: hypothetical protein WCX79_00255 [Candidatus Paceibacterota bacterium]|jgi:hypothetical protein